MQLWCLLAVLHELPQALARWQPLDPKHGRSPALPQLTSGPTAEDACDWSVAYGKWIPTFDQGQYEPVEHGGLHCLVACCADPSCKGLAMESVERYQCYKYSALPPALAAPDVELRALGDSAWLLGQPVRWSIFVKRARPGFEPAELPAAGALGSEGRERALDEGLRQVQAMHMPQQGRCQWMVHYDRWMNTFDPGEYEGVQEGGAHCLDACCSDSDCLGLAMESSEMYQCYRYTKTPPGLDGQKPMNLSDGVWLMRKRPAWSIFLKASPTAKAERRAQLPAPQAAPLPAASQPPAAGAPSQRAVRAVAEAAKDGRVPLVPHAVEGVEAAEDGSLWPWRLLQVLLVAGALFAYHFVMGCLARVHTRLGLGGAGGEATRLLTGEKDPLKA
uniref:Apple domain-containing protein n=1 Tax=Alexandrium monilatum TaxID=311494 RepID=A0A7S4QBL0_9DINO